MAAVQLNAMKPVLFPFAAHYEVLNLKQRWWHRLAIVIFFVSFVGAIVVTAIVVWSEWTVALSEHDRHDVIVNSYHELEPPDDPSTGIDFDFVQRKAMETKSPNDAKGNFDWNKYPIAGDKPTDCYDIEGNLLPDKATAFNGFTVGCAPGQTAKPKTERVHVAKARLEFVEQAEACQKRVVAEYADREVELYRSKLRDCLVPDVPGRREESADARTQSTGDVFDKLAFKRDVETDPKAMKIQVPKVGLIAFPASMRENEVTAVCKTLSDNVNAAERRAGALILGYGLAVLVFLFYLSQVGYRLLLYVVFGGKQ